MNPRRILVVDDEKNQRDILQIISLVSAMRRSRAL
jgi:hypothetical protein